MSGMHEMFTEMWNTELKLAESISTDTPQAKIDFSSMPVEELEPNLLGLHGGTLATGRQITSWHDFLSDKTLLDVGGGTGGLAIAVVEAFPHILATVVEPPNIEPITKKVINEAALSDQIEVISANVIEMQPPGMYDVARLRCLFQVLSPEECQSILHNVSKCLNPGALIYIVGQILEDSRLSPASAVGTNMFFAKHWDVEVSVLMYPVRHKKSNRRFHSDYWSASPNKTKGNSDMEHPFFYILWGAPARHKCIDWTRQECMTWWPLRLPESLAADPW